MAPIESPMVKEAERQLKDVVQNMYNLIVQAVDNHGNPTQEATKREFHALVSSMISLTQRAPDVVVNIPPEVTTYVERSRNPDIFTREFVETCQRMNQMLKGRSEAYLLLRDTLARDIMSAIPELKGEVEAVLQNAPKDTF
ncbi:RNA polymeras-like protein II mediator complex subunit 10 [Amniculicola lignicola CBS 123094]|uniref:Mediator of RNA polymerase II transcription subunit 10 n=1 Tax=Amniculicola lignicola CBS 123094 TaxID=1392246 RepID=A0A6A5W6V7_9PLEO|nr:RNA polymeras-like protein II mediator complex subunit 10 [Amniculicola lignicola CBS 123094]